MVWVAVEVDEVCWGRWSRLKSVLRGGARGNTSFQSWYSRGGAREDGLPAGGIFVGGGISCVLCGGSCTRKRASLVNLGRGMGVDGNVA